jgi:hypothetical protein
MHAWFGRMNIILNVVIIAVEFVALDVVVHVCI